MTDAPSYPKTSRNTVSRLRARGKYDFGTIHSIVNSVPVVHVSFTTPDAADPFPAVLPMIGFAGSFEYQSADPAEEALDVYLHGYVSSRLMKLGGTSPGEEQGLPVTIAATHVDGLVLALTPNNHSYNYRSAILQGYATQVTDVPEKLWAMEKITNGVVPERWDNCRVPPKYEFFNNVQTRLGVDMLSKEYWLTVDYNSKTEMTSTQILKVRIVSASAKVRGGTSHDDRVDLKNDEVRSKTWIGVVPTHMMYGDPIAAPENRVSKVPQYLETYIKTQNAANEKFAQENVVE